MSLHVDPAIHYSWRGTPTPVPEHEHDGHLWPSQQVDDLHKVSFFFFRLVTNSPLPRFMVFSQIWGSKDHMFQGFHFPPKI
jgi:hypothetical protein